MGVTVHELEKDVAQVRKSLKRFPKRSPPERVHQLRSQMRSLEAIMNALTAGRERDVRHFFKALIIVRKAAGKVRDMDVLVELACSLSTARDSECLVQLLEFLGGRRMKTAATFLDVMAAKRQAVLHSLKNCSKFVDKCLASSNKPSSANRQLTLNTAALVRSLSAELGCWPRMNEGNLHSYRLKVKELRDLFPLVADGDTKFVSALGKVKDAIGEWHDWNELAAIAERVLDHGSRCWVRRQIQLTTRRKLKSAISAANELERRYFPA